MSEWQILNPQKVIHIPHSYEVVVNEEATTTTTTTTHGNLSAVDDINNNASRSTTTTIDVTVSLLNDTTPSPLVELSSSQLSSSSSSSMILTELLPTNTTQSSNQTNETSSSSSRLSKFDNTATFDNTTTTIESQSPSPSQNDEVVAVDHETSPPFQKGIWRDVDIPHYEITPEQQLRFDTLIREGMKNKGDNGGVVVDRGGRGWGGGATTCTWKRNDLQVSEECRDMLRPITKSIRRWYFLGDSTMARPFRYCLVPKLEKYSETLKETRSKHRDFVRYLDISAEEQLSEFQSPVNHSKGEGPVLPGNLYRLRCVSCNNRLIQFSHLLSSVSEDKKEDDIQYGNVSSTSGNPGYTTDSIPAYVEFLTMEYARDLVFSTNSTPTTQDTIARYMKRQRDDGGGDGIPKNETACVISSGMHDLFIPDLQSEVYIPNFIAMKDLLKEAGCDIWIRLELTARGFSRPLDDDNPIVFEWNQGIQQSMNPDEYQINLFDRSLYSKHGDYVHMDEPTFYCPLMDFFFELMRVDTRNTTPTTMTL